MAQVDPTTPVGTDRAAGPGNPGRLSGNSSRPVSWKPVYDSNSPNTGPTAANIGVPPPTRGKRLTPEQMAIVKGPATGLPASWIGPQNPAGLYGSTSMNPGNVTPGVDPNQAALLQGMISAQEYQVMQQRQATANAVAQVQKARVDNLAKLEAGAKTGDAAAVKALQLELNRNGYKVAVDGKLSDPTTSAWAAYTKGAYADAQHQYSSATQYASLATVRSENNQALQAKTPKERAFVRDQMLAAAKQTNDAINEIAKAHGITNGFDARNQLATSAMFGKDLGKLQDLQTQLNRYTDIAAQAQIPAVDPANLPPTGVTGPAGMDNETVHQVFMSIINSQKTALQGANAADKAKGSPGLWDDIKGVFATGAKFAFADLLGPLGDALLARGPAAMAAMELDKERGGNTLEQLQSAATSLSVIPFTHTALSEEATKLFTTFAPNHELLGMRPDSREYHAAMDTFSAAARDKLYQSGDILRLGELLTLETNPQYAAKHPGEEINLFGFHGHPMPHTALSTVMDIATGALMDPTIAGAAYFHGLTAIFDTAGERALAQVPARVLAEMEAAHAEAGLAGTAADGIRAAGRQQALSSSPAARLYFHVVGKAIETAGNVEELRFALPGLPQKVAEAAMEARTLAEGDSVAQNLAAKAVIHDAIVSGAFNPKIPLFRQVLALTGDTIDRAVGSTEEVGKVLEGVNLSRKVARLTDRLDYLRQMSAGRGLVPTIFETRAGQFLISAADVGARTLGKTWRAVYHETVFNKIAEMSLEDRWWRVAEWAHNSGNVAIRQAFDGLMRPFSGDQELLAGAGQVLHFNPGEGVMDSFVSAFVQKEGFSEALRQAEVAMAVHSGELGGVAKQQFLTELAHWLVPENADIIVAREAATNTGITLGKAAASATTEQVVAALEKLPADLKEHFMTVLKSGISDAAKAGIIRDAKALLRSDALKAETRRIIEDNIARRALATESIVEQSTKGLAKVGQKVARGILSVSRVVGPDKLKLTYETENEVFHSALRAQAFNRLGNAYNLPNFAITEFVRQAESATTEQALSQAAYGIVRAAGAARGVTNLDKFLEILKEAGAFTAAAGEHITTVNQITGEISKDPQVLAHLYDSVRVASDQEVAKAVREMILSHATDATTAERLAARLRVIVSAPGKIKILFGKVSINDTVHAIHSAWKWLAVTNAALPLAMATAGFIQAKGNFGDKLAGAGVGLSAGLGMFAVRSIFRVTFNESFTRRFLSEGYLTEVSIPGWAKIKSHFGDARGFFNRRVLSENLVMQGQEASDVFFSNHILASVDPGWETIDIGAEKGSQRAVDGYNRIVNYQLNPETDPVVAIGLREKGGHLTTEMLAAEEAAGRNAERLGPRIASWEAADAAEREFKATVVRPDTTFVPNPGMTAPAEEQVVSPLQAASDAAAEHVAGGGAVVTPPTNAELLDQHYPGAPTAKFYRGEPGYSENAARGTYWIPEDYNNGAGLEYAKNLAGDGGKVYEVDLPVDASGKALVGERAPSGEIGWDLSSDTKWADAGRDIAAPVTQGAPDQLSALERMLGDKPADVQAVESVQRSVVQDAVDRGIITAGEAQDPTIVSRVLAEHYATGEVADAYRDTLRNIIDNAGTATERQAARVATEAAVQARTRQYADALIAQFLNTEEGKIWAARWASIGVKPEEAVARMREFIDRYTTKEIASVRVGGGFANAPKQVDEAMLKRTLETTGQGPDYLHVQKTSYPNKVADIFKAYKKATLKSTLTWPDNVINRRPWQRVLFNQEYDRLIKNGVDAVEAQQIADQFATERVNSIAHRYAEQSQFAHKVDIFAPFTHARFDLVRAYSRLLVEHPFQIADMTYQAAQIFNAGEKAGIFQKNPFTGQWQMTVPGSGWLSKALMGTSFEIPFTAQIKDAFFVTGGAFNIGPIPQFGGPLWEGFGVALNKIDPSLFEGDSAIHKVFFPYGPNGKVLPNKAPNLMWMAMTGDTPPWEALDQSHWHNEMNRWQDAVGRQMISQYRMDHPEDLNYLPDPAAVEEATKKFFMAWSIFNSTVPASTYPVFSTQTKFEAAINNFTLGGIIPFTGKAIEEFIQKYPEFEPYVTGGVTKYVGPEDLGTLQRLGVGTPYNRFSKYNADTGQWEAQGGAVYDKNTGEYLGASGTGENYQRESQLGYRVNIPWSDWVAQFKEARRTSDYFTKMSQMKLEPDPGQREWAITQLNRDYADVVQKTTHDALITQELWIIKNRYGSKSMQQDAIARVMAQYQITPHDLIKYQTKADSVDYHIDPWLGARSGTDIAAAVDEYVKGGGRNPQGADMQRAAYVATLSPAEQVTYWEHMKNNVAFDPALTTGEGVMKAYDYYNSQAFTATQAAPWLFRKNLSPTTGPHDYTGENNPWKDKIDAQKVDIRQEMNNAYTQVDLIGWQMQQLANAKNWKAYYALKDKQTLTYSLINTLRDQLFNNVPDMSKYYDDLHAAHIASVDGNLALAKRYQQQALIDQASAPMYQTSEQQRYLHMPTAVQEAYLTALVEHLDQPPTPKAKGAEYAKEAELKKWLSTTYGAKKVYWEWLTPYQQTLLQSHFPSQVAAWQLESDTQLHGSGAGSGAGKYAGKNKSVIAELQAISDLLRMYDQRTGNAPAAYQQFMQLPANIQVKSKFLKDHPDVATWIKNGPLANMPTLYRELTIGGLIRFADPTAEAAFKARGKYYRSHRGSKFNPNLFAQSGNFKGVKWNKLPLNLQWAIEQMKVWSQRPKDAKGHTIGKPSTYDIWLNMPSGQDKALYLQSHQEVQDWIKQGPMQNMPEAYRAVVRDIMQRYGEWTASQDPLGKTLTQFFSLPGYARDQFMQQHPELEVYFALNRTPQQQLMQGQVDTYFKIQDQGARKAYLAAHPELQQHFLDARQQRYERFLNQVAVYMGANPGMFTDYLNKQQAVLGELLRKFSEPFLIRETTSASPIDVGTGTPRRAYKEPGSRVRARAGG